MNFLAIFIALLLEQARPLGPDNAWNAGLRWWARTTRRTLDAGQNGWVTWALAAVVPAVLVAVVFHALMAFSLVLGFVWLVLVLYLTVGFRQFSHHFTSIREALEAGDEDRARGILAAWQQVDASDLPRQAVVRHVIEHSVVAAHRHVFGVLVSFVVFALLGLGPAGAVLYRMSEFLARKWRAGSVDAPSEGLQVAAQTAWRWVDHGPARVTALGFAVVGNFEEAVAAWRQDASRFAVPNDGVVLAATSGAINVRLGGEPLGSAPAGDEPVTDGREPQVAHLASVVGLVWRSVVLWLMLMALMMIASAVG